MSFKQEQSPTHEETFKCAECGAEFTRKVRAKSLTGRNHFCSRKCSRAFYHKKERKGVQFEERTATCRHCGGEFKARIETYKSDAYLPHYCQKPECQEAKKESLGWKKYYKPGQWRKYYKPKGRSAAAEKKEPLHVVHSLTCLECGKEFPWTGSASSRAKPKCCSPECRKERDRELEFVYNRTAKMGRPKIDVSSMTGAELKALVAGLKAEKPETFKAVCECCGKEFEYDVRHSGFGHKRKYCSKACQQKDISARVAMERNEKSSHQVECAVCHRKFWSIYPTAKYCSKRCKRVGAHPEWYLNPDGTLKVRKEVSKTCPTCGREFKTFTASKVYCSDACRKKAYKSAPAVRAELPTYEKECPVCRAVFKTNSKTRKFCSDRCRKRSYSGGSAEKVTLKAVCRECGKEFEFQAYATSSPRFWPKTCSDECRAARNARHPAKWSSGEKKDPEKRVCARCGREFTTTRTTGPNQQKFCSKACRMADIYERNLVAKRKPKVTIRCAVCGKEMTIPEGANRKYCSKECKRKAEYGNKNYVPRDPVEKACRHCGKTFSTRNAFQLYCSKECKAEYRKLHPEVREYVRKAYEPKACAVCGKEFVPKTKTQKTCGSPECKRTLNNSRSHSKYVKKSPPSPRACRWCGTVFTPPKSHPGASCCSQACRSRFKYHGFKSEVQVAFERAGSPKVLSGNGFPKYVPVARKRRACGKEFTALAPGQRYCSKECKASVDTRHAVKVQKTCAICGREYIGNPRSRICSRECSKKLQSSWLTLHRANAPKAPVVRTKGVCKECGREFEYDRKGNQKERSFCSSGCSEAYWNRYVRGLKAGTVQPKTGLSECPVCGGEVPYGRKYCSEACKLRAKYRRRYNRQSLSDAEREALALAREAEREAPAEEKRIAKEEAREAKRAERPAPAESRRIAKAAERRAVAEEREEERMRRVLEVRAKREALKEEPRRLKAERAEWLKAHPEEAAQAERERERRRAESLERRRARAAESAAKKRAARRERARAEREAEIAAAKAEGRQVAKAVCQECGCEFEYVVAPGGTEPRFCCAGCKDHWRWEHGGREKSQAYLAKLKAEGGRWIGRRFVKGRKKAEALTVTWRGQSWSYLAGSSSSFRIDDFTSVCPEQFAPEREFDADEGEFDYDAHSGE